jgi:3-methyladenine DNA glycosylase AlkD
MTLEERKHQLRVYASPERAAMAQRFFKTGKGEYAEGDKFFGATVPQIRRMVKMKPELSWKEVQSLVRSPWHEERLWGLLIWVHWFQKGDEKMRARIAKTYLAHTKWINNWDLVDTSASHIVGRFYEKDWRPLIKLAKSKNLWEKRIAMIATLHHSHIGQTKPTTTIATILLHDKHDLIQKAVGWMLREMGKQASLPALHAFLKEHATTMPRTALRYAIERLTPAERRKYMGK